MFTKRNIVVAAMIAVLIAIVSIASTQAPVMDKPHYHTLGGECTADRATGDLFTQSWQDSSCKTQDAGVAVAAGKVHKNDDVAPSTATIPVITAEDPEVPVVVIIDDGGVDAETPVVNGNNGNHYGNDKPDQNIKDVKNKHNGENTAAEHHDEVKVKVEKVK